MGHDLRVLGLSPTSDPTLSAESAAPSPSAPLPVCGLSVSKIKSFKKKKIGTIDSMLRKSHFHVSHVFEAGQASCAPLMGGSCSDGPGAGTGAGPGASHTRGPGC